MDVVFSWSDMGLLPQSAVCEWLASPAGSRSGTMALPQNTVG